MSVPPPFLILALPRSRTAWLAKFLTYGPWVCGHEQIRYFRGLDDIQSWFMQPYIGSAETVGCGFWRLVPHYAPGCRVVIIRRPADQVLESCMAQGVIGLDREMLKRQLKFYDRKLDQAERRLSGAITFDFDELNDPEVCKTIFEYCLQMPFDFNWWSVLSQINIQIHFDSIMRYMWTHAQQLWRLRSIVRHEMLLNITAKPCTIRDGLEIKEESFEESFRDAQGLFADHCVAIGQPPDEWTRNNIPLMQKLDEIGRLQILTARSNGKMFGYLVSMLGETLDSADMKSATHTLFFASRDWPGAGLRLQREAIRRLRDKGYGEVLMRSGTGLGGKVEKIYNRIGAELDGRIFKMRLQ